MLNPDYGRQIPMKSPVALPPSTRREALSLPGGGRAPRRAVPSSLRRVAAALAALPLALTACGDVETYPQTMFAPRSEFAEALLDLQNLTVYLGVAVGLIVFGALTYILLRFRYRPEAPEPQAVHGNTTLELAWTLVPALILAVIAVPTVQTIFETQREAPANALVVDAIGWQWWWEFRYPHPNGQDTVVTANEIHVPVGTPVAVRLRGGDVVHNFWVPQMGGKRYAIPNRVNQILFTPSEPGVYLGQCAEFCGTSHALMKMRLIAHAPAEFQQWLANEASPAVDPEATAAPDSAILIGKQLVTAGTCAGCHIIKGTNMVGRTGPNLTHLARRGTIAAGILENNAQNLTAWIDNPQAIKPDARMPDTGLGADELRYVVAYLQTLY